MFRDHRDGRRLPGVVDDLAAAGARRVVFAAPSGVSWTLPLYELALLTAAELARRDLPVETTLVTPEPAPLQVFGAAVAVRITELLARHGVRRIRGVAHRVHPGRLTLAGGEALEADRVIAVPRLVGRRLTGVSADRDGFVPTGLDGRVGGRSDVFAAGDVTQYPVKQGGLATQQADVIAAVLATRAEAHVEPPLLRHRLRARLLTPDGPLYLQADLDGHGRALPPKGGPPVGEDAPWWPAAKLFGRHLSPWMAGHGRVPA